MAKFTNVSGADLDVGAAANSVHVQAGKVLEVIGEPKDAGDAWLVKDRLYPKTVWELVAKPSKASAGSGEEK